MSNGSSANAHIAALESALVSEFRAYQMLVALTRDERRALAGNDFKTLAEVLSRKEEWLGMLSRMEASRQSALAEWARAAAFVSQTPTLAEMLPHLNGFGDRLRHLRHGILALADELRDLNRGNRALAASALERVDAVREFLVSVAEAGEGYQPFDTPAPSTTVLLEHYA